eukprot:g14165.t2
MVDVKRKRRTHHGGCSKVPSYGRFGGKAEYCRGHAEDGMADVKPWHAEDGMDVKNKRGTHHGDCTKVPSYGKVGGKSKYCGGHAEDGMVKVASKRCTYHGCTKVPSCGKVGGKGKYCRYYVKGGMVDVRSKRCTHHGCTKTPTYSEAGGNAEYCCGHAEDGMVDIRSKRCTHQGCAKGLTYGKAGGKAGYCRDHAEDGMVDIGARDAPTKVVPRDRHAARLAERRGTAVTTPRTGWWTISSPLASGSSSNPAEARAPSHDQTASWRKGRSEEEEQKHHGRLRRDCRGNRHLRSSKKKQEKPKPRGP